MIALHKRAFSFSLFPLTFFHHLRHRKAHPPRCLPVDSNKFLSSGIKRKYLNQKKSFIEKTKQNTSACGGRLSFWLLENMQTNPKFCGFSSKKKKNLEKNQTDTYVCVCLFGDVNAPLLPIIINQRTKKKKKTIKQPGTDTVFPAFQSQNVCGLRHRFPRKGNDVYAIADEILKQHVSAVHRRRQR